MPIMQCDGIVPFTCPVCNRERTNWCGTISCGAPPIIAAQLTQAGRIVGSAWDAPPRLDAPTRIVPEWVSGDLENNSNFQSLCTPMPVVKNDTPRLTAPLVLDKLMNIIGLSNVDPYMAVCIGPLAAIESLCIQLTDPAAPGHPPCIVEVDILHQPGNCFNHHDRVLQLDKEFTVLVPIPKTNIFIKCAIDIEGLVQTQLGDLIVTVKRAIPLDMVQMDKGQVVSLPRAAVRPVDIKVIGFRFYGWLVNI